MRRPTLNGLSPHAAASRFVDQLHELRPVYARAAEPFARGINSIQLYHDGARWWVVNVFWDSERADNAIPSEYRPAVADGLLMWNRAFEKVGIKNKRLTAGWDEAYLEKVLVGE